MRKLKYPCALYVGTFPPRECGIATFTQDLTNAIDRGFNPDLKSRILAINSSATAIYNYPGKVIMQISQDEMEDYLLRAKEINKSRNIKLVSIQHEYGIFGGEHGNYLLPFMEIVKKPIITTFHTVLPKPDKKLKRITQAVIERSDNVVVMTKSAAGILQRIYDTNKSKIRIIPHGVHHVAFPLKSAAKQKLNLQGKTILSTFGMLNRDKGLEYAIKALPEVVKKFPDVLYLILGATHPVVRKHEGEKYRNQLRKMISRLKLENYVKFYDKYLSLDELLDFLKATDIYISPTLNPGQAVSGTLSYALSCACPIISTANQYAKDTISPEIGFLVRFKNHKDIEKSLFSMLEDKRARNEMRKSAYFYSRHMTWQNVAFSYFKTFNNFAKIVPREKGKLPQINFDHIRTLTDKFGIIQFANHTKPDLNSGYCLDDNSRALLASAMLYQEKPLKSFLDLIIVYLKFVKFCQKSGGQFFNFISRHKTVINKSTSEDSFGRAMWAMGYLLSVGNLPDNLRKMAYVIFKKAKKNIASLESPRAIAFTIIGLAYAQGQISGRKPAGNNYKKEYGENLNQLKKMADKLVRKYNQQIAKPKNIAKKWFWFEDYLTYSNFKMPESLLCAFAATGDKRYLKVAEKALKFLLPIHFEKSYFSAIGQNGWYFCDGKRAYFDQQPEDTSSAVEALVKAYEITKRKDYAEKAKIAFNWFLGRNYLSQMVYDEATGGCYDGLGKHSLNFNQGAESTISYLLARLAIGRIKLF
ncbi:MAG: glycosyltransferase [Patescibacteria group bacterium]|nr:glycosyltransferase [Patescibacteria group bacterium]